MDDAQAFDWAKIVAPMLGAVVGAGLTYFLARGGRRAMAYFHLKDIVVPTPEQFATYPLTIRSGDHTVTGYVYFTALRVKNVGINGITQATVRFIPKHAKANILSIGITIHSTLLAERIEEEVVNTAGAKSFKLKSVASGDSAEFHILLEAPDKLKEFEQAIGVELEADGKLGWHSRWLEFLNARRRSKEGEGTPVQLGSKAG